MALLNRGRCLSGSAACAMIPSLSRECLWCQMVFDAFPRFQPHRSHHPTQGTFRTAINKLLGPLLLTLLACGGVRGAQTPKDTVVLFGDDANIYYYPPYPAAREHLENWVADFAGKGIDILSWEVGINGVCWYGTKVGQRPWEGRTDYPELGIKRFTENLNHLIAIGADPPNVVAEVCHRNGMKMLAAFRMGAFRATEEEFRQGGGIYYNKFFLDHPEFTIREKTYVKDAVDWSFSEVQTHMLKPVAEVAEEYPVDGVELNFIRDYALIFPPSQATSRAPILTGVMVEVRQRLDRAAAKRGTGRLLLAVRVPNDLRLCRESGLDVGTWVRKGLVDFLLPDQRHGMSGDARIEDFVAVCEGTSCKVLPALHPSPNSAEGIRSLDCLRGVVDNWYRRGAQGISTFNWPHPFPPGFFKELRDSAAVASAKHVYPFAGELRFKKAELETRKSLRLPARIAALGDPNCRSRARLRFTAVELDREDLLSVDVDGRPLGPPNMQTARSSKRLPSPSARILAGLGSPSV